ncbi:AlpA family transcriptional regulator [Pseudoxanthobacter sp. M-2]|uniref:helix-turn-helix transcriptional regulator n=1 Tax=Pseudoxanthobacter sp. M-2 TaxID=3078754 RepID=UPI0038FC2763
MQQILRLPEVKRATGLGRSSIYAHIAEGRFPKPVPLSGRAVGWLESEIAAWQASRVAARDNTCKQAA